MTKPYNASPLSTLDSFKYSLDVKVMDNKNGYYNSPDDKNMMKDKDIGVLYSVLHIYIYISTPFYRISMLTKYLDGIVALCNELNLPIK